MRLASTVLISSLLFGAAACGGGKQTPVEEPAAPAPMEDMEDEGAQAEPAQPDPAAEEEARRKAEEAKKAEEEAKKKEEQAQRVAEMKARIETELAAEEQRWTPELRKKTDKLAKANYANAKAGLKTILASPHRKPGNAERDKHRHPSETLQFFGLKPNQTVLEAGMGGGWYTEILAPLLARKGKLIVTTYDPNGPADEGRTIYGQRAQRIIEMVPELYGKVERVIVSPPDQINLGAENSVDLAIVIREMHNWQRAGFLEAYLKALFTVIKPGGTLGVVAHRAPADADPAKSAEMGYLPEQWLIQQIEAAGFKLAEKSEINANPKDTKDHPQGVWSLPPNFAGGDQDREKYAEIGESDRMTLKFTKPKQ